MKSLTTLANWLPTLNVRTTISASLSLCATASSFTMAGPFTSADAKYTLDLVFRSTFAKSASFYEGTGADRQSYIKSVEAPDPKTLIVTTVKPWTGLLSNLVPVQSFPKTVTRRKKIIRSGPGRSSLSATTVRSRWLICRQILITGKARHNCRTFACA